MVNQKLSSAEATHGKLFRSIMMKFPNFRLQIWQN
ncbi:hypothetical protein N568_0102275 [Lactococcus garvieae TRF1]|uniref:Uncharacterized protein n=1 Tax=Lactococcus garvieae TRF1 TaxID=1380772 RepID=V8AS18_9LACT|nr:hypothetical protein N568_0102275 [Lactococcus garvieae TRF1]